MLVVFDAATDQIDLWQFKICPPESTEMSRYQAHRCLSVSLRGVKLTTSRNVPSCRRAARTADLYNPATRHSARKTRSALVGPSQTYSPIWPAADQKWANLQNGEDRISPFWTATHFSHPQTFKQSKPNMTFMTFMVTHFWRHCCCSHSKWTSSVLLMGWKAQENPVIATSSQPFISGQNPKDPAGHLVIAAEPRASQVVTHFWWSLAQQKNCGFWATAQAVGQESKPRGLTSAYFCRFVWCFWTTQKHQLLDHSNSRCFIMLLGQCSLFLNLDVFHVKKSSWLTYININFTSTCNLTCTLIHATAIINMWCDIPIINGTHIQITPEETVCYRACDSAETRVAGVYAECTSHALSEKLNMPRVSI